MRRAQGWNLFKMILALVANHFKERTVAREGGKNASRSQIERRPLSLQQLSMSLTKAHLNEKFALLQNVNRQFYLSCIVSDIADSNRCCVGWNIRQRKISVCIGNSTLPEDLSMMVAKGSGSSVLVSTTFPVSVNWAQAGREDNKRNTRASNLMSEPKVTCF